MEKTESLKEESRRRYSSKGKGETCSQQREGLLRHSCTILFRNLCPEDYGPINTNNELVDRAPRFNDNSTLVEEVLLH